MAANTSNQVYVKDKEYAWVPARVVSVKENIAVVKVAIYENEGSIASDGGKAAIGWEERKIDLDTYPDKIFPLQNVKGSDLMIKEDMVDLPFLHEAAILYNIKARHCKKSPYTRTGDIMISCNPYQWFHQLYSEKQQIQYSSRIVWEKHDCDPRTLVRPHVYEISSLAYKGLLEGGINQSILVSGESGAGKTEAVKICMNHIASIQRGPNVTKEAYASPVVERVLESNPLLEAFGNAKTRRNDNSSRFGKYISLQFSRKDRPTSIDHNLFGLTGSKCEVYLLEKNRVVSHEENEGTFHIFYQLLGASEEMKTRVWSGLKHANYNSYKYVGRPSSERRIEGMTDSEMYENTVKSLSLIDVVGDKFMTLMNAIVVALALGNVCFDDDPLDDEKTVVSSKHEFGTLQQLIGIDAKSLELSLTERTVSTRKDSVKSPVRKEVAKEGCDAFAKEIYAKIFLWLVREINSATCAEENAEDKEQKINVATIGLLDIFGFESFPVNGYEQLCINYANEKLQQKFTRDIFEAVQQEYESEGIDLAAIHYNDNSDVLQLFEGRVGIIKLLNEECVRPKGNDQAFVSKSLVANKKSSSIMVEKIYGAMEFGIHHYAGKVVYYAEGFVNRNKDTLPLDLQEAALASTNEIIANHLNNDAMMKGQTLKNNSHVRNGNIRHDPPQRGKSNLTADTIFTKFKNQLTSLMNELVTTNSRYIRCLKPNTAKEPLLMQHMTTIEQLRCAGVVAAITISRSQFPNRLEHKACVERFRMFRQRGAGPTKSNWPDQVVDLLDPALKLMEKGEEKAYIMGETRVYFRAGALEFLEQERTRHWDKWVVELQRFIRGWLVWRHNDNRKFISKECYALTIQCWIRCIHAKEELRKTKKKMRRQKKHSKRLKKSAIKIQSIFRRHFVQNRYKCFVKHGREKAELQTKILEMERKAAQIERKHQKEVQKAKEQAKKEIKEYKSLVKQEMNADKAKLTQAAQQQALMDECGKIIDYLKKEHGKLKTQNETMTKKHDMLKEKKKLLVEANSSASQSFGALNNHAKKLNKTNARLFKNMESYRNILDRLKHDLKTGQEYYINQADPRLAYQETMSAIVDSVQASCRDPQLVEEIVVMQFECEALAKSERAVVEIVPEKVKESLICRGGKGNDEMGARQRSYSDSSSDSGSASDSAW